MSTHLWQRRDARIPAAIESSIHGDFAAHIINVQSAKSTRAMRVGKNSNALGKSHQGSVRPVSIFG